MARGDFNTAQFWRPDAFEDRSRPRGLGNVLARRRRLRFRLTEPFGQTLDSTFRPVRTGEPHTPGTADRGTARIGGPERRVDGGGDLRKGQATRKMLAQRGAMLRRPVERLHSRSAPVSSYGGYIWYSEFQVKYDFRNT